MAAYLSLMVGEGMNIFVSGETASGKTTLLNALTAFYVPSGKIVTHRGHAGAPGAAPQLDPRGGARLDVRRRTRGVTMFALLKAALRQRPNAIIVGEIRGEEGAIAFQAMQTGHAVAATFHASSVEKLIQRLTGSPINVPKAYVDNLNVVCIASAVRLPNGRPGRRILSINELIGYDSQSDAFSFIEVFRWDASQRHVRGHRPHEQLPAREPDRARTRHRPAEQARHLRRNGQAGAPVRTATGSRKDELL